MNYAILFVTVLFAIVQNTVADDDEDVCCAPRFVDGVKSCPDFENQGLNEKALVMGFQGEDSDGLVMGGAFDVLMSIDDEYELEISVQKLTEVGKEYMYGAAANICGSMKEEDAPWSPVVKSVNITGCPIKEGVYPMSEVVLNLDFASSLMKHEFCGEYEIEVAVLKALDKVACFILSIEVYEK
ncbi:uncharacterized protein LOC121738566 [Aricia agestis]|uniref:uncharacterized protein LOC121738566 n=1 Tax=Aricia agestis TaxID=91739 RepID=UPI001C20A192|nr:uncharacterized protein LOC121738566 [Aricia agestis]